MEAAALPDVYCSPCAANSQVGSGIFAGTSQVLGVQTVYGYGRRCSEQGHESVKRRNEGHSSGTDEAAGGGHAVV